MAVVAVGALTLGGLGLYASGPANAWSTSVTSGTISLVTSSGATTTVPAQLIPGVANQALPGTKLVVDNSFKKGDSIILALFDRTGGGAGGGNSDAAHQVTFTGTPSVTAVPLDGQPTSAAPKLTATLGDSTRDSSSGKDEIVLTVGNDNVSTATGRWAIYVGSEQVSLGASVSPGALRLVPFARTAAGAVPLLSPETDAPQFAGNTGGTTASPTINTYTVPAYVMPVSLTLGNPSGVTSDGTTQSVGAITIGELSPTGLQAGSYRLLLSGASFGNDNLANKATGGLTGAAAGETLSAITASPSELDFTISQSSAAAANNTKVTVTLGNVLIQAPSTGNVQLTYTLVGGSVSQYLAAPGSSPAITGTTNPAVGADSAAPFAGATATPTLVPTVTASAAALGMGNRIGGADRYGTAAALALANERLSGSTTVILASGADYADALSASYLAQRAGGASVLLTDPSTLPTVTAAMLNQFASYGVNTLYVMGGPGSVSNSVANAAQAALGSGTRMTRVGGADRYATNQLANNVAATLGSGGPGTTNVTFGQSTKPTAILASGEGFADALAAAPAVAGAAIGSTRLGALPLVLTTGAALSPTALSQLTGNGITQVLLIGGTGAISPTTAAQVQAAGIAVYRIGGADRYETASLLAAFERAPYTPTNATQTGGLGFTGTRAYLANGLGFADALAGGPLAGINRSAVLLTPATVLDAHASSWLSANRSALTSGVTAFGLQGAISDAVLKAANQALLGSSSGGPQPAQVSAGQ